MIVVRRDTSSVIVGDNTSDAEILLQNAIDAGYTVGQVEILTQVEYDARKALEPRPEVRPNEFEQLTNYVLDVDMRLVMIEMGLI